MGVAGPAHADTFETPTGPLSSYGSFSNPGRDCRTSKCIESWSNPLPFSI
jgi:hypothetical protein